MKQKENPEIYEHLDHALRMTYAQRLQWLENAKAFVRKIEEARLQHPSRKNRKNSS